jgi:hypothetical protein
MKRTKIPSTGYSTMILLTPTKPPFASGFTEPTGFSGYVAKRQAAKALSCGKYVTTTRSCRATSNNGHPKESSQSLRCSLRPRGQNSRGHKRDCYGHSSGKRSRNNQHLLRKSSHPILRRLQMPQTNFRGRCHSFAWPSTLF